MTLRLRKFFTKNGFWLALLLIAAVSTAYLSLCMRVSPWGFSDSAVYLSVARNIAEGKGVGLVKPDGRFIPLTWYPPLYSIALSPFALLNIQLVDAARLLNLFLNAFLIVLSSLLFYLLTQSPIAALCLGLMVAATPALAEVYTGIMSEPLAIGTGLPGFLLLLLAIQHPSCRGLFLAAAGLVGLSAITRYAFITFPIAGVLVILMFARQGWKQKIRDVGIFSLISLLPITLWSVYPLLFQTSVGSRQYQLDAPLMSASWDFLRAVFEVMKYWLPYRSNMIPGLEGSVFRPVLMALFIGLVVGGLIISASQRKASPHQSALFLLMTGFLVLAGVYFLFLFVSYVIVSETIDVNNRMLSPLSVMMYVVLLAGSLAIAARIHPNIRIPVVALLISGLFVVYAYQPLRTYFLGFSNYPYGYASPFWKDDPLFEAARRLPKNIPIITNAPDILLFHTNQSAYALTTAQRSGENSLTLRDRATITEKMVAECGALILFDADRAMRDNPRPNLPDEADLQLLQKQYSTTFESDVGMILRHSGCLQ